MQESKPLPNKLKGIENREQHTAMDSSWHFKKEMGMKRSSTVLHMSKASWHKWQQVITLL